MNKERYFFVDNLRILLTIMVIMVHVAVTYGAEGGWYYSEMTDQMGVIVPLTMYNAVAQSFFMSLFFFVAAFFTSASLNRKSKRQFIVERIIRLGIPLVIFAFILGPIADYISDRIIGINNPIAWFSYRVGPMWFVQSLLLFSIIHVAIISIAKKKEQLNSKLSGVWITLFIGIMVVMTIIARWIWPMGTGILGMQLGSFPQYILMYTAGSMAFNRQWIGNLNKLKSLPLFIIIITLLLALPVFMYFGVDPVRGFDLFMGGFSWQAISYAIWESIMCVLISVVLIKHFYTHKNKKGRIKRLLSDSSYTVYIIHPIILLLISWLFASWDIFPIIKFVVTGFIATLLCFSTAYLIKKIPVVKSVL